MAQKKKSGYKPFLKNWKRVSIVLENKQVEKLDELCYQNRGLNTGRSAMIRRLIDAELERQTN